MIFLDRLFIYLGWHFYPSSLPSIISTHNLICMTDQMAEEQQKEASIKVN
jgi:hypothetical protein